MCIVALAWQVLDDTPLCLISNRDEFYDRPTVAVQQWPQSPIIAGQDLQSGGTWMGVTAQGRWAVLTNIRDGKDVRQYPTSRGHIVQQFLVSDLTPIRFAQQLEQQQRDYAGFNLIVGNASQAVYMSNYGEAPQVLPHGVYVISNGLMSDPWEKTTRLRRRFTQEFLPMLQLESTSDQDLQYAVWDMLQDECKIPVELLPHTGISQDKEILLSSTFIQSENYGTRCSNFLTLHKSHWHWLEKIQQGEKQGSLTEMNIAIQSAQQT